jgi:hypothetical protein
MVCTLSVKMSKISFRQLRVHFSCVLSYRKVSVSAAKKADAGSYKLPKAQSFANG